MRIYFAKGPSNVVGDNKVLSSAITYIVDLQGALLISLRIVGGRELKLTTAQSLSAAV